MTLAELLSTRLRAAGVRRVFGRALPGLAHVDVTDDTVAATLADADGRLGPAPGVALLADGRLRVSSRPGGTATARVATTATDVVALVDLALTRAGGALPRASVVDLQIELDAVVDIPSGPTPRPRGGAPFPELPAATDRLVVLVGPGVVRTSAVDALRRFAAAGNLGVANTWGAKGVFRWDSPHHIGTAGLQARDFELLGFGDADHIVVVGIDPDESPVARFGLAPVIDVRPEQLDQLASRVRPAPGPIAGNDLYTRLAAIAQPGYTADGVPLHPARAVSDLRVALGDTGLVAADPGWPGLWVARTFPTVDLGSVVVPATVAPGCAAALALVARLRGRPAIAVTTSPLDRATNAVLETARELGIDLVVSAWGGGGELATADQHGTRVARALAAGTVTVLDTPVDERYTDLLIEAAGPVVAWGGLPG